MTVLVTIDFFWFFCILNSRNFLFKILDYSLKSGAVRLSASGPYREIPDRKRSNAMQQQQQQRRKP